MYYTSATNEQVIRQHMKQKKWFTQDAWTPMKLKATAYDISTFVYFGSIVLFWFFESFLLDSPFIAILQTMFG